MGRCPKVITEMRADVTAQALKDLLVALPRLEGCASWERLCQSHLKWVRRKEGSRECCAMYTVHGSEGGGGRNMCSRSFNFRQAAWTCMSSPRDLQGVSSRCDVVRIVLGQVTRWWW